MFHDSLREPGPDNAWGSTAVEAICQKTKLLNQCFCLFPQCTIIIYITINLWMLVCIDLLPSRATFHDPLNDVDWKVPHACYKSLYLFQLSAAVSLFCLASPSPCPSILVKWTLVTHTLWWSCRSDFLKTKSVEHTHLSTPSSRGSWKLKGRNLTLWVKQQSTWKKQNTWQLN